MPSAVKFFGRLDSWSYIVHGYCRPTHPQSGGSFLGDAAIKEDHDPWEWANLAADKKFAGIKDRLAAYLPPVNAPEIERVRGGDTRLNGILDESTGHYHHGDTRKYEPRKRSCTTEAQSTPSRKYPKPTTA